MARKHADEERDGVSEYPSLYACVRVVTTFDNLQDSELAARRHTSAQTRNKRWRGGGAETG